MENFKIALVSDWFFPGIGGIEYHIHDLAVCLTDMGHEVHVITRKGAYSDNLLPYRVHRLTHWQNRENHGTAIWSAGIRNLHAREGFDMVHCHSLYSPLALSAPALIGAPIILTDHSFLGPFPLNFILTPILRILLRKVNSFVAVSEAVERDLRKLLGKSLKDRQIFVVPNGINMDFWSPPGGKEECKRKLSLRGTVITTTSRLTKRKRVEVIPKIAKAVKKATPERTTFIIIGEGPRKAKIRDLIRTYDVEDTVIMVGKQPREKVRDYLWASDVYLSPSIYEAFGIAALEALACGVPVLANNHGGTAEIVQHKKGGLISKNDEELTDALLYLITSKGTRRQMGENARAMVESRFSWKAILPRILEVYRKAMGVMISPEGGLFCHMHFDKLKGMTPKYDNLLNL